MVSNEELKMSVEKKKILVTNSPSVLLLGNGIIRAFCKGQSCQDLIQGIGKKCSGSRMVVPPDGLPFPFKVIAVSKNKEELVKKELKHCLLCPKDKKDVAQLRSWLISLVKTYNVILTTNYTYEIEYALDPDFKPGSRKYYRWESEGNHKSAKAHLEKHYEITVDGNVVKIWHVHGEMVKPSGIALGFYQYGRLIGLHRTRVAEILKECTRDKVLRYKSWLEYFLFGNLSVVGFGFDLAEIDMWCLLDCKCRHAENTSVTFYTCDLSKETKNMLQVYGVKVQEYVGTFPDYARFYQKVGNKLLRG